MELATERLILREFTTSDLEAITAYQADSRFAEFYGPADAGTERMSRLLEMFIRWSEEVPRLSYQFAVVERAHPSVPIGSCGVRCKGQQDGVGEFGIELAAQCWGRGLAEEVARALLTFGFRDLGLQTIVAKTVTENFRITRLLERLGFRPVKIELGPEWIREHGWSQTKWQLSAAEWGGVEADRYTRPEATSSTESQRG